MFAVYLMSTNTGFYWEGLETFEVAYAIRCERSTSIFMIPPAVGEWTVD